MNNPAPFFQGMRRVLELRDRLIRGWSPALLCAALIFYLSSRPSSALPSPWFPHMDKFVHALEYAVFSVLLFRALFWPVYSKFQKKDLRKGALIVLLISSLYALSDEIHQIYVPGRAATFPDWMADFLGSGFAVALCLFLTYPRHR